VAKQEDDAIYGRATVPHHYANLSDAANVVPAHYDEIHVENCLDAGYLDLADVSKPLP
jgi:hypothetical protein